MGHTGGTHGTYKRSDAHAADCTCKRQVDGNLQQVRVVDLDANEDGDTRHERHPGHDRSKRGVGGRPTTTQKSINSGDLDSERALKSRAIKGHQTRAACPRVSIGITPAQAAGERAPTLHTQQLSKQGAFAKSPPTALCRSAAEHTPTTHA